jgi:hypothetical protein
LAIAIALGVLSTSVADVTRLFNGTDVSGWQHVGFGSFEVENGVLKTRGGIGLLWFEKELIGNAVLRVVFKVEARDDNSGVFVRIPEAPEDPWMPVNKGLEIQINGAGKSPYHETGSIYTFSKSESRPSTVGEWNVMEITLDGDTTEVSINGQFVSRYTEGDNIPPRENEGDPAPGPRPEYGYIGLQNFDGGNVSFREVSVRPLEK